MLVEKGITKEKELIKCGYRRVQECNITTGRRSGSGKTVFEHDDLLVKISGGSAATKALNYGISSDDINDAVNSDTN